MDGPPNASPFGLVRHKGIRIGKHVGQRTVNCFSSVEQTYAYHVACFELSANQPICPLRVGLSSRACSFMLIEIVWQSSYD